MMTCLLFDSGGLSNRSIIPGEKVALDLPLDERGFLETLAALAFMVSKYKENKLQYNLPYGAPLYNEHLPTLNIERFF
jgi:hypothetical protein